MQFERAGIAPCSGYGLAMDAAGDITPRGRIVESLERSEAQIAAGQIVPLDPVLDRLRASIARMKTKQSQADPTIARKA
jgi:hypothetical protein